MGHIIPVGLRHLIILQRWKCYLHPHVSPSVCTQFLPGKERVFPSPPTLYAL